MQWETHSNKPAGDVLVQSQFTPHSNDKALCQQWPTLQYIDRPTTISKNWADYDSVQSVCTNVFTGLHLSYLIDELCQAADVNDFVPPRLHHRLSAVLNCPPSVTGLFRSPLLVFGTVCLNTSPLHPLWLSSSPILRLIRSQSRIPPLVCAVFVRSLLWTP